MSEKITGSDYCTCELVASTSAGATTLLVSTPTEPFPTFDADNTYFYLTIVDEASYAIDANPPVQREIVKVTAYSVVSTGYSLTVVRGAGGTTGQIWASGSIAEIRPCAQWFQDLKTTEGIPLVITDGITTVDPTEQIFFNGATVTDLGSGSAAVTTAPIDATYVVMSASSALTDERVLTAGSGISIADGGPGGNVTISSSVASINWWYGNGEDGPATLDGSATVSWATKSSSTYTMTRSVVLTNLTINSGVTLITAGYVIYCSGTLTNGGTIHNNGNNGVNGTNVDGGGGNCFGGGTQGTTTNGSGSPTTSLGGSAGIGGPSDSNPTYGANPAVLPTEARGGKAVIGSFMTAMTGRAFDGTLITGGAGGYGGQGNAGSPNGQGAGAGGGGVVGIFAHAIAGSGLVKANGGNGAAAAGGNCGGGGGGGGGVVIIVTGTAAVLSTWTVTANGGLGGAGGGSALYNGGDASNGRILVWII